MIFPMHTVRNMQTTLRSLGLLGLMLLAAPAAKAQNGTWNSDSAGNWSDTTKWSTATVANGADFTATFSNVITADRIITLNTGRTIGNITASDTTHNYTISGGNILTLDRTSGIPTIDVTTSGRTLTISSVIAGNDGLQKNGAGNLALGNVVNQFTGNTVISNGRVNLGGQFSMWQSAYDTTGSTGAIGLNVTGQVSPWLGGLAGSVDLATAITGYSAVTTLNLNPQSGSSVTYGGVIANGSGAMPLNKSGHGTQTLTGTNTYTGATTVWAGTLALSGASGTALNSAFTVRGGTLELDNSTNLVADRIADTLAPSVLSLGSLTLKGFNTGGVQGETVGNTTFAVGGKVTVINGTTGGDQTTLALGTVTRSAGVAINFVGTNGTLGGGANSPNVTTTGTFPGGSNGILPWATVNGTTWAGTASTTSIVAYAGSFVDPTSAASAAASNAQLSGSGVIASTKSFNSLNVIASAAGQSLNLSANTGNLTLTSGVILKSGTDAYTISSSGSPLGNITSGTELIAHVDGGALTISAPLNTAIVGIAKGGTGNLILSGTRAANFTGATSIAGGQLEFRGAGFTLSGAVTGVGGLTVNLNAGQILTMGNNSNSYAGPTIVKGGYLAFPAYNSIGLPGGLGQTPGTNSSLIGSNLILEGGVFNSSYVFNKDLGAGPNQVQVLAGTSGFVNTASQGGAAGFTLDGGREIVWGSTYFNPTAFVHSLNISNNFTLNLANGFDLNGSTQTVLVGDATYNSTVGVSQLGGNIRTSSGTAGFTKTGIGTLLLSGTNTYNGATTVSSGILRFSNQVSLYNNTPASWTATNIVVASGATLAFNVGGTNQFTTGSVTTLLTNLGGANGTSTTGFAAGSSIGFDTTNAAGSTFTVADNIADSSGTGGGAIGVVKLGSNTLVLSGTTNSYSGATIIRGGTLSLTGSLTGNTAISTADNNNGGGGTVLNGILNQSAAGVISGATASFTQGSSGTSILSGDNSYGGGTTLNAGTLSVGHANALGTGTGTIRLNGGTIQSSSTTARTFTNSVLLGGNFTVGGTGNMTFSNTGASALGATRTITVASGITAEFAQAFSGATFGITKAATAGTLRLSGTSTFTGAITLESVAGSVLEVSVMANGGQPSSVGQSANAAANLTLKNATTLRYVGSTNASTDRAFRIDTGTIGHGATIESSGTGTLSFTNPAVANTYGTGAQARFITFGGTNTGNNIYGKVLANNTSGVMTINKDGPGKWIFDQANTYTGVTTINGGTLQFAKQASLYNNTTSSWTAANINVKNGGTLAFNVGGTNEFTTGDVTTLLANLADSSGATIGMNLGSNLGFDTTNASGGSFTIADLIADTTGASGGARGVTKLGTNTLVLTNTNTYTGPTQVNAGTLLVDSTGSLAAGSAVTVGGASASGTPTLGGTGIISGSVTVSGTSVAGTLAPGTGSTGTITLGNGLTMVSGSTLAIGLSVNTTPGTINNGETGSGGSINNFITITSGGASIDPGMKIRIDGTTLSFDPGTTYSYQVASGAGNQSSLDINSVDTPGQFTFNNFSNSSSFDFSLTGKSTGEVYLNIVPVPEPGTILAFSAGLLGFGGYIRRKRASKVS